ncbi:hypothetical protein [Cronobacter turicensis]|uniref:hypothetical protein n=1 Tax=Cronobacter turicensis TaxID=413502 RepID=UPI0024C24E39|nr:hypothetical protein [Cronobacter turicensis]MDK1184819.1 hypothetical protein [Cronobacter turicensis]MDK1206877.1 hypothetical protein [Cronobacter turicensis]MDK1215593.1 hypothetical protein [Cronobacter turicensis]MDK1219817.1 hypothetical protein [Cronobacter turicensis]MDK1233633.1 hypothetical protein [Cronobacter turicensis]
MTVNSLDPTTMSDCTGEAGEPVASCNKEFTHQIKLVSVNGEPVDLRHIPWSVHFDDEKLNNHGNTNEAGKTARVKTPQPKEFFAMVGKLAEGYRRRGNSFGSLKEIAERKISLVTAPNYPEKEVPYCNGYDYIAVVAARTAPRDWRWQGGFGLTEDSPGNQYRFINCGIRQLRDFPAASEGNTTIQRILVVFQAGYTSYDIGKINEYAHEQQSRVVYVKNKNEFIDFLNQRKVKKRLIKKMVFFCHGVINIASFHYAGDDESAGGFEITDIQCVYESVFDYDAEITTYACRAGISVDGDDFTGKDAGQKNSPAQKMADAWDVKIHAFEKRSSYVGIYGTQEEIIQAGNYYKVIKDYTEKIKRHAEEVAKGNKNMTQPHKPDDYEENIKRMQDLIERTKNEKNEGGPLSPNGAWRYPRTGNTPTGLKRGLQQYTPCEWDNDKVKG